MKVIFLDIDGVLNNSKHNDALKFGSDIVPGVFDENCVDQLKRILAATGARIVISSSWRKLFDHDEIVSLFSKYGINNIIGSTPNLLTYRGHEIQAWLDDNPNVESFVILDDDDDMVHLSPKLVQTDWDIGLSEKDANEAIKVLNGT